MVYKKIVYKVMVSLKMVTTFVMHAMTLVKGAAVVMTVEPVVVVVMFVAVNHYFTLVMF
jgi:hypothetical protein